jgi:DNA-binding MarR family transcriptional regulator
VRALIDAGYVEGHPDDNDARATLLSTTEDGRRVLAESHRRMVHAFGRVLDDWSEEDIASLAGALDRLRNDFSRTTDKEMTR